MEKTRITVDQFDQFIAQPENKDRLFELIDGEIVEKVPTEEHGRLAVILAGEFYIYFKRNPIGFAGVEVRHRMPADHENAYIPDISITLDVDTPVVTRGAVPHMPDIAIEIKSRDDHYTDLRAKAAYYLANGTKIVWLVYPEKKLVEVYAVGQDSQLYDVTDTLDCGDLLPDFSLPVKTIFGLQ